MPRYEISNRSSGAILGTYEGDTEQLALLAAYRDAGYGRDAVRLVKGQVVVLDADLDSSLALDEMGIEELPVPPALPVKWTRLSVTGPDGSTEERWASGVVEALREFRETGGMDGRFFGRMGFAHEEGGDAATWGPQRAEDVDWAGFDAYAAEVAAEDRPAGGVSLCSTTGCDRRTYADGLCEPHYRRARRGSTSTAPVSARAAEPLRALSLRVPVSVMEALGDSPGATARQVLERWAKRQGRGA